MVIIVGSIGWAGLKLGTEFADLKPTLMPSRRNDVVKFDS